MAKDIIATKWCVTDVPRGIRHNIDHSHDSASLLTPVENLKTTMLALGWCPHQIAHVNQAYNLTTLQQICLVR